MAQDQSKRTVLISDDHPIFRTGLRQIFEEDGSFEVIAEVGDGKAALVQIEMLNPDFAILDLNMPGFSGFDALKQLEQKQLKTRAVIVSMHADEAYARRARDLGAIGFIAKEDAPTEVIAALKADGADFFMSQSVGGSSMVETFSFEDDAEEIDLSAFTKAERNILVPLSTGKTSKEIARELNISPKTVQAHRRNIVKKLGISGPNRLLQMAVRYRSKLVNDQ